jgi:hypothetical protein
MGAGWSPPSIEPERGRLWPYLSLPWRRYEIDTHLRSDQCVQALQAIVEPRKWFRWPRGQSPNDFEGEVTAHRFSLRRIIRYRNSFLPIISGIFGAEPGGTRVSISMRPHWFALVFWIFWMTGVLIGAAAVLFAGRKWHSAESILFVIMLAFGYLICVIPFGIEAEKARQILADVLTGRRSPIST